MIDTNFTINSTLSADQVELHPLIESLLIILSDKEKYIIENRFALKEKKRKTLEELGQYFGITRERVRQIEKSALRKLERNAQNTNISILTEFAKALLEREGGVCKDSKFKALLIEILKNISEETLDDLHLALVLDKDIVFEPNTLNMHPYFRLASLEAETIKNVSHTASSILKNFNAVMQNEKLTEGINKELKSHLPEKTIKNILQISKEFKFTESGIGLYEWRHINPKTLKDKIEYVFQKEKRPMHFSKLAEEIKLASFDTKRVNIQAVHNELIRNEEFVLIGRGIYALRGWGYKTGTVFDVIKGILEDGTPRTREEISKAVLEQRHVKTITIYLNLKNRSEFARVGRDKYTLARFLQQ